MKVHIIATVQILVCFAFWTVAALKEGECGVCVKFLTKVQDSLEPSDHGKPDKVEAKLRKACSKAKTKENRFCYYIGGTEDAATGMLSYVYKPMSYSKPVEKICAELNKKDHQICQLQYEQKIDLKNTNLKKLRVKQLKKILNDFDEQCTGCVEKSDYIKKIQEVMKEHTEL